MELDNLEFDFINNKLIKFKKAILLKISDVNIPFGIENYKEKLYLTLEVDEDNFLKLNSLEENIKNKYFDFLEEIKKNVEIDIDSTNLTLNSYIKKKNQNKYLIKFKIKTYRNNPIISIDNNISCFEIKKNTKCDVFIILEGIWNYNNTFGILSYIKSIKIPQNK